MTRLAIRLLGPFEVTLDGEPITQFETLKTRALLAYLAVTGVRHNRDTLATLLWPEKGQSSARAELRRGLYFINKALGNHWLAANLETIGLNPELNTSSGAELWLDLAVFQQQLKTCEDHKHSATDTCPDCIPHLEAAVDLYTDHFMAGFSLPDCPEFDEWQFFQTQGLKDEFAGVLERLPGELRPDVLMRVARLEMIDPAAMEELDRELNPYGVPSFPSVAVTGEGVFEAFEKVSEMLDRELTPRRSD